MATQEAYVKRVIKTFNLRPDDLDTTTKIFCDVFRFCQFTTTSTTFEFTTVEPDYEGLDLNEQILTTEPPVQGNNQKSFLKISG